MVDFCLDEYKTHFEHILTALQPLLEIIQNYPYSIIISENQKQKLDGQWFCLWFH